MPLRCPPWCCALLATAQALQDIWLLGTASFTGGIWDGGESARFAGDMMASIINEEARLLPGYRLRILWQDERCSSKEASKLFMDNLLAEIYTRYPPLPHHDADGDGVISTAEILGRETVLEGRDVQPRPVALLLAGCSVAAAPVIRWAHRLRLPVISGINTRPDLSNRSLYPNYFRTITHEGTIPAAIWRTVRMLGLSRATVVVGPTSGVGLIAEELVERAREVGIKLMGQNLERVAKGLYGVQLTADHFPLAEQAMKKVWRAGARVAVAIVFTAGQKELLCAQVKLGYQSLVWFTTQFDASLWSQAHPPCSAEEMLGAANGGLLLQANPWSPEPAAPLSCSSSYSVEAFRKEYYEAQGSPVGANGRVPNNYSLMLEAPAVADAVCMYALMLRELLFSRDRSLASLSGRGPAIYEEEVALLSNSTFDGLRGLLQFSPGLADPRNPMLSLYQLQAPGSPCFGAIGCRGLGKVVTLPVATIMTDRFLFLGRGQLKFHFDDEVFPVPAAGGSFSNVSLQDFSTHCQQAGQVYNTTLRSCAPCGEGQVFTAALEACSCKRGYIVSGSGLCQPCAPGRFSGSIDAGACRDCEAGRFAGAAGSSECMPCTVGRFASLPGSRFCEGCAESRGSPERWATLRMVGEKWEYAEGSTSPELCGCRPGSRLHGDGECRQCGEGLDCRGMNSTWVLPNYYSAEPLSVYRCHGSDGRCPGGVPGKTCHPGRHGLTCSSCLEGLALASHGKCVPCSAWYHAVPALAALLVLSLLTAAYFLLRRPALRSNEVLNLTIFSGLLLTSVQVFQLVGSFQLFLWEPLSTAMAILSLFSFSFDFFDLTCFRSVPPVYRFLFRATTIFMASAWLLLVHCVTVLLFEGKKLSGQWYVLKYVLGTMFMAFYIAVVSAVLSPLQCEDHPNGAQTMRQYQGTLCWISREHLGMAVISVIAFLCIPVPLVVRCAVLVWEFPQRMCMADSRFLRANGFLFFRFQPSTHWYCLVILARSMLCAGLLVIPNAVAQALLLQLLLIASLVSSVKFLPWRTHESNVMEVLMSSLLVIFCSCTSVMAEASARDREVISYMASILVTFCGLPCAASLVVLSIRKLRGVKKRFQFFLCHHKAGAGAFTRLLKQTLLESPVVKREVFVDSDNLENLSALFHLVGTQMETLIIIASHDVFRRPWCLGEMTVTRKGKLKAMIISMPDADMPSDDFIVNCGSQVSGMEVLVAENIQVEDVQETLAWTYSLDMHILATPLRRAVMYDLTAKLCGMSSWPLKVDRHSEAHCEACMLCDPVNLEAMAAALVLQKLMLPHLLHHGRTAPLLLSPSAERGDEHEDHHQELPSRATEIIILLSEGIFEQDWVLETLVAAAHLELRALTVTLEESFRFPSKEELQALGDVRGGEVAAVVAQTLKEISISFQPQHASLGALKLGAKELARRVTSFGHLGLTPKPMLVSPTQTHKAMMMSSEEPTVDSREVSPAPTPIGLGAAWRLSWQDAEADAAAEMVPDEGLPSGLHQTCWDPGRCEREANSCASAWRGRCIVDI